MVSKATICFAFTSDFNSAASDLSELFRCRWFTRGWTLQELLAPRSTEFYDCNQVLIGTKLSLERVIAGITGISPQYLRDPDSIFDACIAERMCWASTRETTRLEDRAYSLLGLFNVNMPLLYGEGTKAFTRLQQAIVAQSSDETIFAWTATNPSLERGMLALSPREFSGSRRVRRSDVRPKRPPSTSTNQGLDFAVTMSASRPWVGLLTLSPASTLKVPIGCQMGLVSSSERLFLRLWRESPSDLLWKRQGMIELETQRRVNIFQDLEVIFGGYTRIVAALEPKPSAASSDCAVQHAGLRMHQARTSRNVASNFLIPSVIFAIAYFMMVSSADLAGDAHNSAALPVIQWVILSWAWKLCAYDMWFPVLVSMAVFLRVTLQVWIWAVLSILGLSFVQVVKGSHRR